MPIFSKTAVSKSTSTNISGTVAEPEAPKPSIPDHGTHRSAIPRVAGKNAFATPSITDALREDTITNDQKPTSNKDGNLAVSVPEVKPFLQEKLAEAWKIFVEKIDAPQLKSALSSREPILKANWRIEYELDNEMQLQRLTNDLKPKLLGFLRRNFSNESIEIEFLVIPNSEERPLTPYTDAEKWNSLVEKYPALANLKTKFGLDFEH